MSTWLVNDLEEYLTANTTAWAGHAKAISERLGSWAAERLESTSFIEVESPEFAEPLYISGVILNHLLAPETVRDVLEIDFRSGKYREKSETDLRTDLADYIMAFLVSSLGPRNALDQYDSDVARLADLYKDRSLIVTPGEGVFGQAEICEIVDQVISQSSAKRLITPSDYSSIICLDTIDLALYKALQEHPELLTSLEWRTFEKLLADLLERSGYEVELQRGTKDGGIDLFAIRRSGVFGPERFLLQAKRWRQAVGIEPVRQLAFLHAHHRVTKSCLATTSIFTKGAWRLASQYRWQLELLDIEGIKSWLAAVSNKFVI